LISSQLHSLSLSLKVLLLLLSCSPVVKWFFFSTRYHCRLLAESHVTWNVNRLISTWSALNLFNTSRIKKFYILPTCCGSGIFFSRVGSAVYFGFGFRKTVVFFSYADPDPYTTISGIETVWQENSFPPMKMFFSREKICDIAHLKKK
jgi:hypothetical protein